MNEALQQPADCQVARRNINFTTGITVSVVLHLLCTGFLLTHQGGERPYQPVSYVDLRFLQAAQPMTAPSATPAAQPAPATPKLPEPTAKTEIPQEPQKPAEAPKAAQDQPAAAQPSKVDEQLASSSFGLGLTRGYFRSMDDGVTLRDDIKGYFLGMLQGINEKWWLNQEFDKKQLEPIRVFITVARNGEIVDSQVLIGSGNPRYDRAVVAAVKAASPLPPLPATYQGEYFQAPITLVPPRNLFSL